MGCDCARAVPRWILTTLNFILLSVSLFWIFLGVLFTVVPSPTISLVEALINREWLGMAPKTSEFISSLLNTQLVKESGQVLLTLGLGVALPSAVGYVGAVRESRFLLVLYLSPLLLAWGLQLLTLLLLPALQSSIYRGLSSLATSSLSLYQVQSPETHQGPPSLLSLSWDHLMAQLSCCGVSNFTDFSTSMTFQESKQARQLVPASCCILDPSLYPHRLVPEHTQCVFVPTTYNSFFLNGCLSSITSLAASNLPSVILAIILLLSVEMVIIILAVCLCLLQRSRTDKLVRRETVVVREQAAPNPIHHSSCHQQSNKQLQQRHCYREV